MAVTVAALFSDGMVLQRELPIPVWGWAEAGQAVAVTLAGNTAQTVASADGTWRVTLPALPAGGPYEMTVSAGSETLRRGNILLGDVWICSGQSNMQMTVCQSNNAQAEMAAANYPQMRLFSVPMRAELEPLTDVDGAWQVCTPETVPNFSAVGYFFGRELHQQLGVPMGLINTSWGGTLCEAWTSCEALSAEPSLRYMPERLERFLAHPDEVLVRYEEELAAWERSNNIPDDPGNQGYAQGWADPQTDTAAWAEMALPAFWQNAGHAYSGVFWFRREVEVPAAWAGRDLVLNLGPCDKNDITYFNNEQIGSLTMEERNDAWATPRVYTVPGRLVRAGRNTIAVRVFSNIYNGGMHGLESQYALSLPDAPESALPLAGAWRYQIEHNFGLVQPAAAPAQPPVSGNPNTPGVLYNAMIAPLVPYGIRGAIWYQGESNADRGEEYRTLFPTMIRDWRARWGEGDFPFYFVQLANFMHDAAEPGEYRWAELREAQTMTLSLPMTGMAVIMDIGDPDDIHPTNKQDVGKRLAYNALQQTYGMDVVPCGPLYRAMTSEGNAIRLQFDHVAGGLMAREGGLRGFAIAGADRHFVWANAAIDGDTVVVSSPRVPAPVAVRYGWSNNPAITLYNSAGLPASPFRTDDWIPADLADLAAAAAE